MIDLHTHTLFSDGELIPAELTRRAAVLGYRAIAMTDHGDLSNLDLIIPRVVRVADDLSKQWGLKVVPGIELTHVPPAQFNEATVEARKLDWLVEGMPHSTTRLPVLAVSIAVSTAAFSPATSKATSTPSWWVAAMMRARSGPSGEASKVRWAPKALAASRRWGRISVAMISEAPATLAIWMVSKPIGPQP